MNDSPEAPMRRLVDQVQAAEAAGGCLRICGTGSKDFYGRHCAGEPLDTCALCGIRSYEPSEMVITVGAGTPLAQLEAALADKGQGLAFEPPRFHPPGRPDIGGGTVGGMIAAGLAGPARASAGGVRDFVLGVSMLNGRGELLHFGGQVMKNVAGYDLSRLLAGSLGVLGVICEVSLKVPPVPAATATLLFAVDQDWALQSLHRWAAAALPLSASSWYAGQLHLRLSGARAAVDASRDRLVRECAGRLLDPAEAAVHWDGLRDHSGGFFTRPEASDGRSILWRLSVPATQAPLACTDAILLEWGGAQRWIYSDAPDESLRDLAAAAGGHATRFSAGGRAPALPGGGEFLPPLSAPIERIHRALKQSFDPSGVFNRGRLYSWL